MRGLVRSLFVMVVCLVVPFDGRSEIRTVAFQGWDDCLELTNATARVVVAPAVGGRILHYSRDGGPNILWEDPRAKGETLATVGRWFPVGGYQLDIGPELGNPPRHLPLWLGRYRAEKIDAVTVRVTSPQDEATGILLVKEIKLAPAGAGVSIRQTMKNVGQGDTAYCLWDRTLTPAGGYGFFELNPKSRFRARWSMRRGERRAWRYDGVEPSSPRVRIVGGLLVTIPGEQMEKVGGDCERGWVAGSRDSWLFVKRFPVQPAGDYADGGNRVEIYVDGRVTELEPLSPKVRLAPGESYSFDERWDLRRVEQEVTGADDIPKLLHHVSQMAPLSEE